VNFFKGHKWKREGWKRYRGWEEKFSSISNVAQLSNGTFIRRPGFFESP
jgi:hypothetical protein